MNYLKLETFLVNLSFFFLLASMLSYWIEIVFFSNLLNINNTSYKIKKNSFSTPKRPIRTSSSDRLVNITDTSNKVPAASLDGSYTSGNSCPNYNCDQNVKKQSNIHFGQLFVFLANVIMFFLLLDRWLQSGHFPLSNLYESLIFLSWSLTSINLWIEKIETSFQTGSDEQNFFDSNNLILEKYPDVVLAKNKAKPDLLGLYQNVQNSQNSIKEEKALAQNFQIEFVVSNMKSQLRPRPATNSTEKARPNPYNNIFGGVITPIALIINAFASFSLPPELREATSLVPALQSNWLIMHVTVIMLSYAAILAGCIFSLVFLLFDLFEQSRTLTTISQRELERQAPGTSLQRGSTAKPALLGRCLATDSQCMERVSGCLVKSPKKSTGEIKDLLDNLSYRTISIGFLLLTIGIFSGAVWANEAWGSYWSWDPKETWALITWFIFAIYLHARIQLNWSRKKTAMIACSGFIVVWICYLGVNLLGQGLHSYGFIKISR